MDAFIVRERPLGQLFEKDRAAFVSLVDAEHDADMNTSNTTTVEAAFKAHGGAVVAVAHAPLVIIVQLSPTADANALTACDKSEILIHTHDSTVSNAVAVCARWVSDSIERKQRLPLHGYILHTTRAANVPVASTGPMVKDEKGEEPERKKQRVDDNGEVANHDDAVVDTPKLTRAWKTVENGSLYYWDARGEDNEGVDTATTASIKLAAFDMDGTLIVTKSGKRFAQDANDWRFFHPTNVGAKLQQLARRGFTLVLLSNQNGVDKGKTTVGKVQHKMQAIVAKLNVPMLVLFATRDDEMRKPRIGAWRWLLQELGHPIVDMAASFYCGDAAGRPKIAGRNKDFAATDYKFALNLGVSFHTPEALFLNSLQRIHTRPERWEIDFDPHTIPSTATLQGSPFDPPTAAVARSPQEMVLVVGPPASGKSLFAQRFTDYVCVCQDDLKTVAKCIAAAQQALGQKKSVVVDCTNRDAKARREWLVLAQSHGIPVRCFVMEVAKPLSMHLNTFRKLTSAKDIPDVAIHTFFKNYVQPAKPEGFDAVIKVRFRVDVAALAPAHAQLIQSFL